REPPTMGQKAHPTGQRLGFIKGWDSNWYGGNDYTEKLVEDEQIRQYLMARLKKASVAKIVIERTLKLVTVTINTARPGVIIGKGGAEVDKLREELKKLTGKDVQINIFEISVRNSTHAWSPTASRASSRAASASAAP